MAAMLMNFIPLAIAAIAPVGMGMIILLLISKQGIHKALAFLISQALAFAIWGIIFLNLSSNFVNLQSSEPTRAGAAIRVFLGILIMVIAIRMYVTDHDLDAVPLQIESLLEKIGVVILFFLNLILSLLQIRFVLLIMIGTNIINAAHLSVTGTYIGLLILLLVLLWPQLLPIIIFLGLRDNKEKALKSLNDWMFKNARLINAGLLGILAIYLLWGGLVDLAGI